MLLSCNAHTFEGSDGSAPCMVGSECLGLVGGRVGGRVGRWWWLVVGGGGDVWRMCLRERVRMLLALERGKGTCRCPVSY